MKTTKLDEIRERHAQASRTKERRPLTWANLPYEAVDRMHADINHLLALLQLHPASEPPDTGRLVIVRWRNRVRLGRRFDGAWRVRGWAVVDGVHCPVESWQELPFEIEGIIK